MMTLTAADITARIARSIRLGRERATMSQDTLAGDVNRLLGDGSNVRRNEIRRWERGTHRPREHHLIAIAFVLGVDYAWLLAEHDNDNDLSEEAGR